MTMLLVISALAALLSLRTCSAMSDSLIVKVSGGWIRGAVYENSIRFMGIPYGTARRFQAPSPAVEEWPGLVRNASRPGPQCLQRCPAVVRDLHCLPQNMMSETCLYLNVYRPRIYNLKPGQAAFPVMVYIHGGGFESGSGAAPLYDGDYLANTGNVIVVTINYRLGAFGFLPIFNKFDDVMGNFGLQDQQVALKWVKNNIAAFNGDPNKVTLFGAEAGCQSIGLHLTSLDSDPLFHSAILQSCPFTLSFRNKSESRQIAKDFATALGCSENDVVCMRRKDAQEILKAQNKVTDMVQERSHGSPSLRMFQIWGPVVDKRSVYDSSLLDELINVNLRPYSTKTKPVMLGFVSDEGRASVNRKFPLPVTTNSFKRLIETELPDKWRKVAETRAAPYHSFNPRDVRAEMVRFLDDFVYICPARKIAQQLTSVAKSQGNRPNVWVYDFNTTVIWPPGGSAWPPGGERYCQDNVCQGLDLLYLFNPARQIPQSRQRLTKDLTEAMAHYWTNFAKFHNPNGLSESQGSSQTPPVTQGSLLLGRRSRTTQQQVPAGYPSLGPRFVNQGPSFLQPAAARSTSPSFQFRGSNSGNFPFLSGLRLASMLSQMRRQAFSSPPVRPPIEFVSWPPHVLPDTRTLSSPDMMLELTQPIPKLHVSLFGDVCRFWEVNGYN